MLWRNKHIQGHLNVVKENTHHHRFIMGVSCTPGDTHTHARIHMRCPTCVVNLSDRQTSESVRGGNSFICTLVRAAHVLSSCSTHAAGRTGVRKDDDKHCSRNKKNVFSGIPRPHSLSSVLLTSHHSRSGAGAGEAAEVCAVSGLRGGLIRRRPYLCRGRHFLPDSFSDRDEDVRGYVRVCPQRKHRVSAGF